MFPAEHLPVLLKHTALGASTHEMEITLAGGETAAHSRSRLSTAITALEIEGQRHSC